MNNLSGSILGCGWLGLPLAKKLVADGFKIKASKTNSQDFDSLKSFGISPFVIELTPEKSVGNFESFLKEASFLIIDIPPGLRNITNDTDSFINKIKHCIPFIEASSVKQVVFISSTSVYGDSENYLENTTENTAVNPDSESGRQLVLVEKLLLENLNFKTTILRFGGLIGPNRNPIKYLAGKKNVANPYAPINFIHQEDCIEIIRKMVSNSPSENRIFNAVAPFHPTRKNYYKEKAKEENLEIPEFDTVKKSIGKKISSQKLQSNLDYTFMHSSL
ncbi:MAG: nucleoside-diphosphate-sugar epimerase [Flavobacterium sp.]|jgi:nucleoside-diphosphate-sugar epimerase